MNNIRYLIVTADDFGIGPETSRGILELAEKDLVTGTVLLVNSPHAEAAVRAWRKSGVELELGWHPCLTLDRPVLPVVQVPSLVGADGYFHSLGSFIRKWFLGKLRPEEIEAELRAQYGRFHDLVGHRPTLVNSHHHVQVFSPVGAILLKLLGKRKQLPYLRRIREPWGMLASIPGARKKRAFLTMLGKRDANRQANQGFPGNDWLAGITDPPCVRDTEFFSRWLARVPGQVVELTCHPGYSDKTLVGRDCSANDAQLERRVLEMQLLRQDNFLDACRQAGFTLVSPCQLAKLRTHAGSDSLKQSTITDPAREIHSHAA